jgi:cytochrome P450
MIADTYRITNGADILDEIITPRMQKWNANTVEIIIPQITGDDHIVETMEPRNVQTVLATKFEDWEVGEKRHRAFRALLGNSIFTSDGGFWEHSRALFRPIFTKDNLNDLEETDHAADIMIDILSEDSEPNGWTPKVNMMDHFFRFTLDTSAAFLFGATTDSQLAAAGKLEKKETLEDADGVVMDADLSDSFRIAQEWLQWRMLAGTMYWAVTAKKWRDAAAHVLRFVDHFVQVALKREDENGEKKKKAKYNLLSELATRCHDPKELRDQTLAILGAGRDTTATLLSWLWLELAHNPEIFAKLRQEVLDAFGENDPIDFAQLKSCKPLQHAISETLRLYPPVPINSRQANKDTILPLGGGPNGTDPLAVRAGQLVAYDVYPMQRRADLWGADAEQWNPDRWIGRKFDWSFVPFSGGPRICLGQQYALMEASYLTVKLLRGFDGVEWVGGERKAIGKGFTLTMGPGIGVPVRLRRARR